jgi:hypothetical protein
MRDQGIIPDSIKEGHLMACAKAFVIVEEKKEELAKLTKKASTSRCSSTPRRTVASTKTKANFVNK